MMRTRRSCFIYLIVFVLAGAVIFSVLYQTWYNWQAHERAVWGGNYGNRSSIDIFSKVFEDYYSIMTMLGFEYFLRNTFTNGPWNDLEINFLNIDGIKYSNPIIGSLSGFFVWIMLLCVRFFKDGISFGKARNKRFLLSFKSLAKQIAWAEPVDEHYNYYNNPNWNSDIEFVNDYKSWRDLDLRHWYSIDHVGADPFPESIRAELERVLDYIENEIFLNFGIEYFEAASENRGGSGVKIKNTNQASWLWLRSKESSNRRLKVQQITMMAVIRGVMEQWHTYRGHSSKFTHAFPYNASKTYQPNDIYIGSSQDTVDLFDKYCWNRQSYKNLKSIDPNRKLLEPWEIESYKKMLRDINNHFSIFWRTHAVDILFGDNIKMSGEYAQMEEQPDGEKFVILKNGRKISVKEEMVESMGTHIYKASEKLASFMKDIQIDMFKHCIEELSQYAFLRRINV